jgi:predicted XRE-type DNA-binding protein
MLSNKQGDQHTFGIKQAVAARKNKQPRIAEIMSMKTECFSVDLLLKYLACLGKRVEITVTDVSQVA